MHTANRLERTAPRRIRTSPPAPSLSQREGRLIHLALAIGAGREAEVRRQVRACRRAGLDPSELCQVAMLGLRTLDLERGLETLRWIDAELLQP